MKQKFRLFCKNKYHKFLSAVLLVLPGLRNSAFFIYRINDERRCRNCTSAFLRFRGVRKCNIVKSISVRTARRRTMHHSAALSRQRRSAVQSLRNAGTARTHSTVLSVGRAKIPACGQEWTRSMVQRYPDARQKTRGACQLHRGVQSRSLVRPLCNRKQFSCLPPQTKISWILYSASMRLSGYTNTRSISSSASSVVSVSTSRIALVTSLRLSCRTCSSCFCACNSCTRLCISILVWSSARRRSYTLT